MNIICLGWGSLIWDPDGLPIPETKPVDRAWRTDGPFLPVEFARHSRRSGIMTLVIVEGVKTVPVLWSSLLVADLDTAKRCLAIRECRRKDHGPISEETIEAFSKKWLGYWTHEHSQGRCAEIVAEWAASKDADAVLWTDLPARYNDTDGQVPTSDEVLQLLRGLSGEQRQRAMEYVMKAPKQV